MTTIHRIHPKYRNRKASSLIAVSVAVAFALGAHAHAQPVGGQVVGGVATIQQGAVLTTIQQSSQNTLINWQSFGILPGQTVQFVQPNSSAVALNRVLGSEASQIFGTLAANGQVFLVNPNGILFAPGASVNVGGLVASTLNIGDSDFMAGNYQFFGTSKAPVSNQGSISANGGYVAMLGANVSNQGVIQANMGSVILAAGDALTLDMAGDGLLNVAVDKGAVNALIENGGLIRANGGKVLLTASTAGNLLQTVVNNTGVVEAQTLNNTSGVIQLLADLQSGKASVSGTLDASAPNGGNGGFIEASAARVKIEPGAVVTTAAPSGNTGTFLIDPENFIIGGNLTDNISGADLSALLVTSNVTITTAPDLLAPGDGDIFVNQAVSWTAPANAPTTLSLNAVRDVNINAAVTAVNGNFQVCCGRDINVNEAVTTTNGSVLFNAGRDINMRAAMTTTDGNITMCAAEDLLIAGQVTLTRGSSIPSQSLGLPLGLVLNAGFGGTGPGIAGGTLSFAPLTPNIVATGPNAPVSIKYNPVSYLTPSNFSGNFTLTNSTLTQRMLVFADGGSKTFDGDTATTLSGLKGSPVGVTLLAGPGSSANFVTADVGINKAVTYSGFSLDGTEANNFALAENCCGQVFANTTASVSALPIGVPPPVVVPPVVVPPVVAPPLIVAPPLVVVPPNVVIPPLVVVAPPAPGVPPVVVLPPVAVVPPVGVAPPLVGALVPPLLVSSSAFVPPSLTPVSVLPSEPLAPVTLTVVQQGMPLVSVLEEAPAAAPALLPARPAGPAGAPAINVAPVAPQVQEPYIAPVFIPKDDRG